MHFRLVHLRRALRVLQVIGLLALLGAPACGSHVAGGTSSEAGSDAQDGLAGLDDVALDAGDSSAGDVPLPDDATTAQWSPACYSCHGTHGADNPAPPKGTDGTLLTTDPPVGAHQHHLGESAWHRRVQCADCHLVPTSVTHHNGVIDFDWSGPAIAGDATPTFAADTLSCSGAWCHGVKLFGAPAGQTVLRQPVWNQVDGTFNACGAACHTTPPGPPHPPNANCAACHGAVIASFDAATQQATWNDAKRHVDGTIDAPALTCTTCHGDPATGNAAPPKGTQGETGTTSLAVGAHQQHLTASNWHGPVACSACHTVPGMPLHADGVAQVTFSGLAQANGASPDFAAPAATCSGAYCHGATLPPAKSGSTVVKTPKWTQVDGTFNQCGAACHTTPPGGAHPSNDQCQQCHGDVIAAFDATSGQAMWKAPVLHINGKVEVSGVTCTACHGDAATNQPAPPKGTHGETAESEPAVGAHMQHLGASAWHREVQCGDCHVVPTAPTHANGSVDFAWGGPSAAGGAAPAFSPTALGCSGTWCHGAMLPGSAQSSAKSTPNWTQVDGTFSSCGMACHTTPPPPPHPGNTACQTCHSAVIAAFDPKTETAIWKDASRHIDGTIDAPALACTTCHGNPQTGQAQPPQGTHGEVATTAQAVGAHASHLQASNWHRNVQCADCHLVPTQQTHADGTVQLQFGAVSTADGATPSFDEAAATCSGAYCHGATLVQASAKAPTTPKWTQVDGTFNQCGGACHMTPPGGTHPQNDQCQKCHSAVVQSFTAGNPPVVQWLDASQHINGKLDLAAMTCTTCHGNAATGNPAPPLGPQGETQTTEAAVGAHQQHLGASNWHRQGVCQDCHVPPTANNHSNGQLDLSWGAVALAAGATPVFDAPAATCSGAYCHGATLPGAKPGSTVAKTPKWTQVDGTFGQCGGACHTTPPGGTHPQNDSCQDCHGEVIAAFVPGNPPLAVWANASKHVDGVVNVQTLSCTTCHGDAATQQPAPPKDTQGNTATTFAGVGAHAQHLNASAWHRAVQCADCHVVPTALNHADGQVELSWGGPATVGGATPVLDAALGCSGTWCHGAMLPGQPPGMPKTPQWTQVDGTFSTCGQSCHTTPPVAPHPPNPNCAQCHGDVIAAFDPATQTATWQDATRHVNGVIDVLGQTCTSCHGDAAKQDPAPPKSALGLTQTTDPGVGAHQAHLHGGTWHRPVQCADCHVVPASLAHANGVDDLAWSAVALANGATPIFDATAATCSGGWCHGAQLPDKAAANATFKTPKWTQVDGTFNACGTACHTMPPGGAHPASQECAMCHSDVIAAWDPVQKLAAWTNPGLHIDGKVRVQTLTCTTCHGNAPAGDPSPPKGAHGETMASQPAVGAHRAHLDPSTWHRPVQCAECHVVPAEPAHSNGIEDVQFSGVATTSGTTPQFDPGGLSCSGAWCHGAALLGPPKGQNVARTPNWVAATGTYNACGLACHSTPPGPPHTPNTQCGKCHGEVIQSFDAATGVAVWKDASRHVDGKIDAPIATCTTCHGDAATQNPAPPLGTQGETATTSLAVGAHAQHVSASAWHHKVQCAECHLVPTTTGHADGIAAVTFGTLSAAGGAQPQWQLGSATCSGAYCHGATLQDQTSGVQQAPKWTQVDGTFSSCGQACHGAPPAAPHPNNPDCAQCHGAVIASFNPLTQTAVWQDATRHIDGKLDAPPLACTSCHGDAATQNPAPPLGSHGETATTAPAVGAHSQHLATSGWHRQVQCSECHLVPGNGLHANGTADLQWSGVAAADGAQPLFDPAATTCSGSYCHGGTLPDATTAATVPKWTQVDGTFSACGQSCHGTPPGGLHPQSMQCQLCHGEVIASFDAKTATAVWQSPALHVDGKLQVKALTCTSCHGDAAQSQPAPPLGVHGETLTTQAAVGAHRKHVDAADWHRQVQCADCHVVPTSTLHTNDQLDLAWSGPALEGGAVPLWNPAAATCQNTGCHGASLANSANAAVTPVWTKVDGTFASCGQACHGTPPGGTHPPSAQCQLCHGAVIAGFDAQTQQATWQDATQHIDGKLDLTPLTCTTCHGDAATGQAAPPKGTHGEAATSTMAVGAHAQHLAGGTWHRQVQCSDCHAVPTSMTHTDGVVEMTWSGPAVAGNASPALQATSQSCSGVWCHGSAAAFAADNPSAASQPTWTQVDGTFKTCGAACHMTPPGGAHPQSDQCQMCHAAVIASFDAATHTAVWNDATQHINGNVDVSTLTCTTCHGDAATQNPAPPAGTHGETLTTQPAVGAHAQHLATPSWHRQVQCADCHVVPTSVTHTDGVIDLLWSGPAVAGGATPTFDAKALTCAGAWCHGSQLTEQPTAGPVAQTPKWTQVDGSFKACGQACHGAPPGPPHPQNLACNACHGDVIASYDPQTQVATWKDASRHIDGVLDAPALSCTACHGNAQAGNPAPPTGPQGETATTELAVGAHDAHLGTSAWHRQVACADCHQVPSSPLHANGVADFAWSAVAAAAGAAPVFDAAAATCSGTYCHGSTLPAPVGQTPVTAPKWTQLDGAASQCGAACHTLPPGGTHPANDQCQTCHAPVIASFDPATKTAIWANPARHIDGQIDVSNLTCTSCHGDAATQNPAPPKGSKGETQTTDAAVGAHTAHLGTSAWHRQVACADCHLVPSSTTHANGQIDFAWSGPAAQGGAAPAFDAAALTCSGTWCHGTQLWAPPPGQTVATQPKWTQVDGSFKSCGQACHATPPGSPHVADTQCEKCHGAVIATFDPATQTATWKDATRHIDGVVDAGGLSCTSCHGDAAQNDPAPPFGSKGETLTTQLAVGAHQQHQGASAWHRTVACTDCHLVPASSTHANGVDDLAWGAVALAGGQTPVFSAGDATCSGVACHGAGVGVAKLGASAAIVPKWTQVDGSFNQCGSACHTLPPGGTHPQSTQCQLCHTDVIAAFDPKTSVAAWLNPGLHIDGVVEVRTLTCTTCHGDAASQNPAPPKGTHGETQTTDAAVGAHASHLNASGWHRQVECADCHLVPTATTHANDTVDIAWSGTAAAGGATPSFDSNSLSCSGAYCHGATLGPVAAGVSVATQPIWTQVNGTFNQCGSACHTTPPGGTHPQSTQCQLCHDDISAFNPATQTATWSKPSAHIDGKVDLQALTCTSCHGDAAAGNAAPPLGTHGETATTAAAVGAHASHLDASTWHRVVQCTDCHVVPASLTHTNGVVDLAFAGPATAAGASPAFDATALTCSGAWCHGSQLVPPPVGKTVVTQPKWTQVDGTFKSCGQACHSTPPGPPHPPNTACQQCHGDVIASFDVATQTATWKDATRHIDGVVDAPPLACTTCHGDANAGNPAPPKGPAGEMLTTNATVGAHAQHLAASTWHRPVQCADCHVVPTQNLHANGQLDLAFAGPAIANAAAPSFDAQALTCTGAWCHGAQMDPPANGQPLATIPLWTQVDGTFSSCGQSCHTTPPGGSHPTSTACQICHGTVIASFDVPSKTAVWQAPSLHVNGSVDVTAYHALPGWTTPKFNANGSVNGQHHGAAYFIASHGVDDKGATCVSCHGSALDGGPVNVSCSNSTVNCHGANAASNGTGGDWKACNFCHGNATQQNPPSGVWNEQATNTLAVGAHAMHLKSTATHVALSCDKCHVLPASGDTAHTQQYVVSTDLSAAGHHGDVTLPGPPAVAWNTGTMVWSVAATLGAPITARGTCTGACHSDGRSGAPAVVPYWAGGAWTDGSCASCHLAVMKTAWHSAHTSVDNNNACTVCHPAASSASHVNGQRDVYSTIVPTTGTGSITNTRPTTGTCANRVQCSGTCHNQDHSNECWR